MYENQKLSHCLNRLINLDPKDFEGRLKLIGETLNLIESNSIKDPNLTQELFKQHHRYHDIVNWQRDLSIVVNDLDGRLEDYR